MIGKKFDLILRASASDKLMRCMQKKCTATPSLLFSFSVVIEAGEEISPWKTAAGDREKISNGDGRREECGAPFFLAVPIGVGGACLYSRARLRLMRVARQIAVMDREKGPSPHTPLDQHQGRLHAAQWTPKLAFSTFNGFIVS